MLTGRNFETECIFSASRSSGPGGQHVNKVSTKMELRFNVSASQLLRDDEKTILMNKLTGRINKDGFLILVSQSERSQFDNKARVIEKFFRMLEKALKPVKKRNPTRPTAASKARRLESKHIHARKKTLRKIDSDE